MSTYTHTLFLNDIDVNNVKIIFELGSRDLVDAIKMKDVYTKSSVYAFECNPESVIQCEKNLVGTSDIVLVKKAVSITDGPCSFFPFDRSKYDNVGASSLLLKDFSTHSKSDPDYNKENPQYEVVVDGTRIDTFCKEHNISNIDLLCIDLQGYELNALKSMGDYIKNVKYIITELSICPTYKGGARAIDVIQFLSENGFTYTSSIQYGYDFPNFDVTGFSEFDALFVKN